MVFRAADLSPIFSMTSGGGHDKHNAASGAKGGEFRVLGQKPVARVDGLRPRQYGGGQTAVIFKLLSFTEGGPMPDAFIRQRSHGGLPGPLRKRRRRLKSPFPCRRGSPDGDLAPVCDEYFGNKFFPPVKEAQTKRTGDANLAAGRPLPLRKIKGRFGF
jgi:hypothetical protein